MPKRKRYNGERHDFWEIVYVDKGEVDANTESGHYRLNQGNVLIHSPNEYHQLESMGNKPPNLFIVTFRCDNGAMAFFEEHKLFHIGHAEHAVLAQLMKESRHAFEINTYPIRPKQAPPFAAEQLFKIYLEQLLIQIVRSVQGGKPHTTLLSTKNENQSAHIRKQIIEYLEQHLSDKITLDFLSTQFSMSKTQLNVLFKRTSGTGIITYLQQLKIEHAKKHIREDTCNLTEIADLLGYSSVHYFSRHFKKAVGMTPSEYAKTIKARND
ncbi:AraC family transcriptional regulator [Paenibacillus sp. J5C_2022]|uniref:AraC family transcriptional regulator n=1 Tax=Paenibacillus sp. J5C2022 TaxID=2977129 RepID=UPI0021D03281|nr:AraC family transcriptional regulator [Paenibacillus sp. J5C2022]MCU6712870.1 AraC family transcriptional regulator [Paenibacillus sp. J5C2022]